MCPEKPRMEIVEVELTWLKNYRYTGEFRKAKKGELYMYNGRVVNGPSKVEAHIVKEV